MKNNKSCKNCSHVDICKKLDKFEIWFDEFFSDGEKCMKMLCVIADICEDYKYELYIVKEAKA